MSFGGPIDSMINKHKENTGLLGKRKRLKDIQQEHPSKRKHDPVIIRSGSNAEYLRFKSRIKDEKLQNQNRFVLILGLTMIILMVILYWVMTSDFSGVIDMIE